MWRYHNTDELYHYGVLGMRWGHRKATYRQNKTNNRSSNNRSSNNRSSNKKSKKMSMKKKIAIGAAVTASIIAGVYAHKKFKDYKAELNRNNKKYSEYKKKVKEIINNKKASDDKWKKEIYNIYTHPNPLTGELRGVPVARRRTREMKSRNLNSALREIEDLNRKTFSNKYETSKVKKGTYTPIPTLKSLGFGKDSLEDHVKYFKNEEDMRKEISNFMGKTNRKKKPLII